DRAHLAQPRRGGAEPGRQLGPDVRPRHPAPEHARPRLGRAARLQRVDERLHHARADGWPQGADGGPADLRGGPDGLQLAGRREPDDHPVGPDAGPRGPGALGHSAPGPAGDGTVMPGRAPRFLWPFAIAVYALLLAPLVVVIAVSFGSSSTFDFPPKGLSLRWYQAFFSSETFVRSFFRVSQFIGLWTALVATVVGALAAIGLVRLRFRGRQAVETFFLSPLVVPHILLGAAVYLYLARLAWPVYSITLLLGHIVIATPYLIRCVTAGLVGMDPRLEEAAMSLGATRAQAFFKVTLPLLRS